MSGFVYVMGVLVSLEGKLSEAFHNPQILYLLSLVFQTICTAMRFEPANAKTFYHEICKTSLCDTLRLLGCFRTNKSTRFEEIPFKVVESKYEERFYELFIGSPIDPK